MFEQGHAFGGPFFQIMVGDMAFTFRFYPSPLQMESILSYVEYQGCSHQYGWSGFNQTTFRDDNHISANILEFGGVPGGPVGSHVATVDRVEINGCK